MKSIRKHFPQTIAILLLLLPISFGITLYFLSFSFLTITILTGSLHLVSTIPIQFLLSYIYKWESKKTRRHLTYKKFSHPRIFKQLALAIIYPYFFIFLLFIIRFMNLGERNNLLFELFSGFFGVLAIIVSIIIIVSNFYMVLEFLMPFFKFKGYLWSKTSSLCFSIYLYLLQKNWFFFSLEKIHKLYFFISLVINLKSEIYWRFDKKKDFSYLLRLLSFFYNNDQIFPYALGIVFVIELTVFHKIYYFYYLSFIYLIILYVYKLFATIGHRLFVPEVSLSDYLYKNLENPRYKKDFVIRLMDPMAFYGFENSFNPLEMKKIHVLLKDFEEEQLRCLTKLKKGTALCLDKIKRKLFKKINTKKYPRKMRVACYYYKLNTVKY